MNNSIAGVWVKASERLPEFENRDKGYVIRYSGKPENKGLWTWDWINNSIEGKFPIEWLDESQQTKTDFQIAWELSQTTEKPFFIDTFRKLLGQYDNDDISLSKFVEELNIAAYKWHQQFSKPIPYWQKRCEAAERCYDLLNLGEKHKEEYKVWAQLKSNPSPTPVQEFKYDNWLDWFQEYVSQVIMNNNNPNATLLIVAAVGVKLKRDESTPVQEGLREELGEDYAEYILDDIDKLLKSDKKWYEMVQEFESKYSITKKQSPVHPEKKEK